MNKIYTIGVYGFNEAGFFDALEKASIQTLVDIRWRRGVRGREYAFANSRALQRHMAEMGIRYIYRRDLAPTPAIRQIQYQVDQQGKIAKRRRTSIDRGFIEAYDQAILNKIDLNAFGNEIGIEGTAVALVCVEKTPAACHRSLLCSRLAQLFDLEEEHLLPWKS